MKGNEEVGVTANEYKVSFGDDENILKLDDGDGYITLNIFLNIECMT